MAPPAFIAKVHNVFTIFYPDFYFYLFSLKESSYVRTYFILSWKTQLKLKEQKIVKTDIVNWRENVLYCADATLL